MNFNYNQTPLEIYGFDKKSGVLAMELEVEGDDLPGMNTKYWKSHADGSLKLGGVEYVHKGPQTHEDVNESLRYFEERIVASGATVFDSERTSVHVHLNVQDRTIKQILSGAVAYYMLEPALMNHCGEARKGNLFCLTMDRAGGIIDYMQKISEGDSRVNSDTYRYASMNFGAIKKFGSLEVRTMRGYYDVDHLSEWGSMLDGILTGAAKHKTPKDVFDSWYGRQPVEFMAQFLTGKEIDRLRSYTDWDLGLDRNHKILSKFVYDNDWEKKEEDFKKEVKQSLMYIDEASELTAWSLSQLTLPTRTLAAQRGQWIEESREDSTENQQDFKARVIARVHRYCEQFFPNSNQIEDLDSVISAKYDEVFSSVLINQIWSLDVGLPIPRRRLATLTSGPLGVPKMEETSEYYLENQLHDMLYANERLYAPEQADEDEDEDGEF